MRADKLRVAEAAKVTEVVKAIKSQMRKHGLTIAHLNKVGTGIRSAVVATTYATKRTKSTLKTGDKRLKVKPKYRHKKTGETWAGRGKPPRWMVAEIKAGKKKEDFLIK